MIYEVVWQMAEWGIPLGWSIVLISMLEALCSAWAAGKISQFLKKRTELRPQAEAIRRMELDEESENAALMELYRKNGYSAAGTVLIAAFAAALLLVRLPLLLRPGHLEAMGIAGSRSFLWADNLFAPASALGICIAVLPALCGPVNAMRKEGFAGGWKPLLITAAVQAAGALICRLLFVQAGILYMAAGRWTRLLWDAAGAYRQKSSGNSVPSKKA